MTSSSVVIFLYTCLLTEASSIQNIKVYHAHLDIQHLIQLLMQSVPITTNVASLNPAQARCTTLCDKVCQ